MKILITFLIIVFFALQYKLWVEPHGLGNIIHLRSEIKQQITQNDKLETRNNSLQAEVTDLKHGQSAVEEHARHDLGMIKPGETFYQVVGNDNSSSK